MTDKPPPLLSDLRIFLALGGGVGLIPKAPGTAGTLLALPLHHLLATFLGPSPLLLIALAMIALGIPICEHANRRLATHDDGRIVWDEIAAFFLVLTLTPPTPHWQLTAFILFRLLDTLKPFPINWLDRKIKGGWGIMADDIAAALLTILLITVATQSDFPLP